MEVSHSHLSTLLHRMGRLAEENAEHRKLVTTFEKLAVDNPAVPEFRVWLGGIHGRRGQQLLNSGDLPEAVTEFRQALALKQKLVDDNPTVASFRHTLASSHQDLGNLVAQMGKLSEAESAYRKALAIRQKLAEDNPGVFWIGTLPRYGWGYAGRYQWDVADSLDTLGRLCAQAGKNNEAMDYYLQEEAVRQSLVDATSSEEARQFSVEQYAMSVGVSYRDELAGCQIHTANFLRRVGKHAEACAACDRALVLLEPLAKAQPENPVYRRRLAEIRLLMLDLAMPADPFARDR
jgi:tetratricopeptide (TPR) repeat protein